MKAVYSDEAEKLMQLHYRQLGERDRRRYAALEVVKLGYGGLIYISRLLSVDVNTLMKGKKELLEMATQASLPTGKQRRPGGGRKKKDSTS